METFFKYFAGVLLMAGGIWGVHNHYEYSGWAIFLGVLILLNINT